MAAWAIIATAILFLFGLAILALASSYLVTALVKVANIIKLPVVIVGALILGIGTSIPELSNALMSVAKGLADLGVGNIIGAAVTDLTLVMGIIFLIAKKEKLKKLKERTSWLMMGFIAAAILMLLVFGRDNLLSHWEGALMLAVFAAYQVIIFKKGFTSMETRFSARKLVIPYLLIPLALFSILIGAFLVVDTGIALATLAGISAAAIGLTVVAIGTTMPELIEGTISARQGHHEMAIGSVLGGAVIVVLFILGLVAAIFTLPINYKAFLFPSLFIIGIIIYQLAYTSLRKQTDKLLGGTLVGAYLIYLLSVLI